jgi:DNA topoisomerase-1
MGTRGTNTRNGNAIESAAAADSVEAAEEAGLKYVNDDRPGYRRKAKGKEFDYLDTEGKTIREEQRLLRIKRLAIPPAWTDVWICPSSNGHIQATGRDARGRKQYRYHERWREVRDENKFDRLAQFAKALPNIRRRVARDLKLPDLPRQKVLATIVRLLERTFIRIGNEEYARDNKSFGLTTLKNRHVKVKGARVLFRFKGKSGREHEVDVTDRKVAKIIAKCQDLPGQDLFQYLEKDGEAGNVTSQDVNDYLRQIAGEDFTAKDFRTWGGTVLAAIALSKQEEFQTKKQAKSNIKTAICAVAELLGNTPAVCRKCYIHPVIVEAYLKRTRIAGLNGDAEALGPTNLRGAERAVLKFLHTRKS